MTTSTRSEFAAKIEALAAQSSVRRVQGVKASHFAAEAFDRMFGGVYLRLADYHYALSEIEEWPEEVFRELVGLKWTPKNPCHPLEALAKMDDDAPAT